MSTYTLTPCVPYYYITGPTMVTYILLYMVSTIAMGISHFKSQLNLRQRSSKFECLLLMVSIIFTMRNLKDPGGLPGPPRALLQGPLTGLQPLVLPPISPSALLHPQLAGVHGWDFPSLPGAFQQTSPPLTGPRFLLSQPNCWECAELVVICAGDLQGSLVPQTQDQSGQQGPPDQWLPALYNLRCLRVCLLQPFCLEPILCMTS